MAANFSAVRSVSAPVIVGGHVCTMEVRMLAQACGISPEVSGIAGVFSALRKNSEGVAKISFAGDLKLSIAGTRLSSGAHRSVPQCIRMGLLVVLLTSAMSFWNRALFSSSVSRFDVMKVPHP